MIISDIVREWPVIDSWSISPGVPWCAEGNRVRVCEGGMARVIETLSIGDSVTIDTNVVLGMFVKIGDGSTIHQWSRIGDNVSIEPHVTIREHVIIDGHSRIGTGSVLPDKTCCGSFSSIPPNTRFVRYLGQHDGCSHSLIIADGEVLVSRDNQHRTFAEAHDHFHYLNNESKVVHEFAEALARAIPETARLLEKQVA